MLKKVGWLLLSVLAGSIFMQTLSGSVRAFDSAAYDNLERSRNALLAQRDHLQDAYDKVSQQLDQLQQTLSRLDGYLRQNDQALRDVESAMRQTH